MTLLILAGTVSLASGDVIPPGSPTPGSENAPALPGTPVAAAAQPAPLEVQTTASRLVDGPIESQIALLRARLAITHTERGPFGFYQDPKKLLDPIINIPTTLPSKPKETPFEDVVNSIPISIVNAAEQEFMAGGRTFASGDEFPIEIAGESIPVRVEAVRLKAVTFRNTKTNKVSSKSIDLRPEGVIESAGGELKVAGLTTRKAGNRAPLALDLKPKNPTTIGGTR